jgi:hypothetical protein
MTRKDITILALLMVLLPSLQPITVRTRVYELIKQTSSLSRDERDVVKTALVNALIPRAPEARNMVAPEASAKRAAPGSIKKMARP